MELIKGTKNGKNRPHRSNRDHEYPRLEGFEILLTEDSPDNQLLISRYLELAGAKVDIAGDGIEGFQKAAKRTYDIILMDIQMPYQDGREVTQKLRKQGYTNPIVALTAHAMVDERKKSLDAGCDEHLNKPINRRLLLETIIRLCDKKSKA